MNYEYKVLEWSCTAQAEQDQLNQLATVEGWELVAAIGTDEWTRLYLKRPRS